VGGKFLGVQLVVAAHAGLFVGATWLALGVSTGVWDAHYFACVPLLLFHFACFYSVSTLLAVVTRSTVASVLGTVATWLMCWGVNYAYITAGGTTETTSATAGSLLTIAYWLLPKPADLGIVLLNTLHTGSSFASTPVIRSLLERGAIDPALVVVSSCLLPVAALLASVRFLSRAES
jgi:hypothetical protein